MKNQAHISIALPVLLVFILIACENSAWNCLRGNGTIEKESRELQQYSGVLTEGEYDIYYIPDTSFFVVLETDQNLLPYIRTRVSGNTLIVDNGTRKCLRSDYPIRVYVHSPEIKLMNLMGSGKITAESVYSDELKLVIEGSGRIDITGIDVLDLQVLISGSGDVNLRGETDIVEYSIAGSGTISAQNLLSNSCLVEISGSGDIYCNAEEKLDVFISGSGNIYYKGTPSISTKISGSGKVVSIN